MRRRNGGAARDVIRRLIENDLADRQAKQWKRETAGRVHRALTVFRLFIFLVI